MKILVTGVAGQLGYDVVRELMKRGHDAIGSDILPVYKNPFTVGLWPDD